MSPGTHASGAVAQIDEAALEKKIDEKLEDVNEAARVQRETIKALETKFDKLKSEMKNLPETVKTLVAKFSKSGVGQPLVAEPQMNQSASGKMGHQAEERMRDHMIDLERRLKGSMTELIDMGKRDTI